MAKHKAPTQVTLASTTDESALHEWVQRLWKPALAVVVVATAWILGTQIVADRAEAELQASWDRFGEEVSFNLGLGATVRPAPAGVMASLADDLQGTPAGPWARLLEASQRRADGEFGPAAETLQKLREEAPDHPLLALPFRFEEDGPPLSVDDFLVERMDAIHRWKANHPELFENPALPEGSPRVRMQTSRGAIVLGLYEEQAPEHVRNFLKLCGEGFYEGTLFHRIQPTFMIQGGDPNSREGEPDTWGQGGPGYTLPAEPNDLRHFSYVLAAAKKLGETDSSGSQFYITVAPSHHLDGLHTVFGTVLEGSDVVDEIAAGTIVSGTADRPQDPVRIDSTETL